MEKEKEKIFEKAKQLVDKKYNQIAFPLESADL